MKSNIILRVRTRGGISRITLPGNSTLFQLKEKIFEHTKIPIDSQKVHTESPNEAQLEGDQLPLYQFGLKNGDFLSISSPVGATITPDPIESTEGKHFNISNLPEEMKEPKERKVEKHHPFHVDTSDERSVSSSPSNPSSVNPLPSSNEKSGFRKTDKNEPHFKSFDQYLKENDFKTIELPANKNYKPQIITLNHMNKLPPTITLKYQPYRHVDHLELMNINEVQSFVKYWRDVCDMSTQRFGWMFGYYKEDTHYPLGIRGVLEAIYEPPQTPIDGSIQLLDDPDFENVKIIAQSLGLELIGMIFTHLPRERFLTASEVTFIADLQLKHIVNTHYTGYPMSKFITCTISLDVNDYAEPFSSAFMISDLGMELVRNGLIDEKASSESHISLRKAKEREILPQILESGKATTEFDADWFLVRVNESAPKVVRSIFSHTHFPRENRSTPIPITCFKEYFEGISKNIQNKSNFHKFLDFHLLLHIYKTFDLDTVKNVLEAIHTHTPVEEAFEDVLISLSYN